MITIVILLYSLTLLKMMVEFKGYKSNVNTVIHDLSDDSDPLYLENSTFQIAFEVSYVYENSTVYSTGIDSFLNISLGQAIQTTNENGQVEINHHIRQYSQWGENGFVTDHENVEQRLNISETYLWPISNDFVLQGNSMSNLLKFGEIYVTKWKNGTDSGIICQEESVIEEIVDTIQVKVALLNTYFDFNELNNPIGTFIDKRLERGIRGFTRYSDFYIRENEAILQDNYLSIISDENHHKFIHVDIYNDRNMDNSNKHFVIVSFYKSYQKVTYERYVYTFMDLVGSIGGVYGLLSIIGYAFVSVFLEVNFNYSILSNLYQIDTMECQIDHDEISKSFHPENTQNTQVKSRYEEDKGSDFVEEIDHKNQSTISVSF